MKISMLYMSWGAKPQNLRLVPVTNLWREMSFWRQLKIGFIYANRQDLEQAHRVKWACIVYVVIKPEFRKMGIAQKLYDACVTELKNNGISNLYVWANSETDGGVVGFMNKNGFSAGHKYLWMDKKI